MRGARKRRPGGGTAGAAASSALPAYARIDRSLSAGDHPYLRILPEVAASPALERIAPSGAARTRLLERARVEIRDVQGYAFVDDEVPCIVVAECYFREGTHLDLYLDLLHEITHLRQLEEGFDLWDERFAYVDRPTEIEAYAVAIEEGRRLGMNDAEVMTHVSNPWMTPMEVARLLGHVGAFLETGMLANLEAAKRPAPRRSRRPW
ncbi:MAG: hypothetical protein LAO51_04235 [Acidobacteriia bacterium]|nr:hypothetical protein [Terriglobia bacterium]